MTPSPRLAAAIVAAHAAAGACLAWVVPGAAGMVLAALMLVLGAASARDRALLRGARSLRALELAGPGEVTLALANGERVPVRVGARRGVNRYWVSLPVSGMLRRTLLLTADMFEAERFRLLRLWALWDRVPCGRAPG